MRARVLVNTRPPGDAGAVAAQLIEQALRYQLPGQTSHPDSTPTSGALPSRTTAAPPRPPSTVTSLLTFPTLPHHAFGNAIAPDQIGQSAGLGRAPVRLASPRIISSGPGAGAVGLAAARAGGRPRLDGLVFRLLRLHREHPIIRPASAREADNEAKARARAQAAYVLALDLRVAGLAARNPGSAYALGAAA